MVCTLEQHQTVTARERALAVPAHSTIIERGGLRKKKKNLWLLLLLINIWCRLVHRERRLFFRTLVFDFSS